MRLHIDGDIVTYSTAFTTENLPEYFARARFMNRIESMLKHTKADEYKVFLTSSSKDSFRHKLYPEYKANRTGEKPKWYDMYRQLIMENLPSEMAYGCEADDLMGVYQTSTTIIASTDKDLNMIPGWHYNFNDKNGYFISDEDARHNFYVQLLTGDATDNIPGLKRVGPKTAEELLDGCTTEDDYYAAAVEAYKKYNESVENLHRNAKLLWIWRGPNDIWERHETTLG